MSISSAIANDKLTELRNKKKQAIQALDFDAAEEYDRQIHEANEQIIADRIAKINSEILKDLNDHINKYSNIRREIEDYNNKQESQLNLTYQELLDKAQVQHEKELRNIDKSHGVALLREAEREVPDQLTLLEQAKAAASAGRYEEARNLRDKARNAGENELEERKQKVDMEFEESRAMLATKQQDAIAAISQKYEEEIQNLNAEVQLRKLEMNQRFESGVNIIRQRAEVRCNSLVADDEIKEDALFELNQRINDMLNDFQSKSTSRKQSPNKSVNQASPRQNDQIDDQQKSSTRSSVSSYSSTSTSRKSSKSTPKGSGNPSSRMNNMSAAMSRKITGSGNPSAKSSGRSSSRSSAKSSSRREAPRP